MSDYGSDQIGTEFSGFFARKKSQKTPSLTGTIYKTQMLHNTHNHFLKENLFDCL